MAESFFINKLFLFVGTVLGIEAFNNFLGDVEGFVCIKHVAAHLCEDEIAQARCRAAALDLAPVSSAVIDLMKEYFS